MCVCVLGYDFLKLVGRFGIILFHFYYRHICGPNVLRTEGHLEMTLKATIYGQKKKNGICVSKGSQTKYKYKLRLPNTVSKQSLNFLHICYTCFLALVADEECR